MVKCVLLKVEQHQFHRVRGKYFHFSKKKTHFYFGKFIKHACGDQNAQTSYALPRLKTRQYTRLTKLRRILFTLQLPVRNYSAASADKVK